jgi:hypothetical protein
MLNGLSKQQARNSRIIMSEELSFLHDGGAMAFQLAVDDSIEN